MTGGWYRCGSAGFTTGLGFGAAGSQGFTQEMAAQGSRLHSDRDNHPSPTVLFPVPTEHIDLRYEA